jgi:hypothetical protein
MTNRFVYLNDAGCVSKISCPTDDWAALRAYSALKDCRRHVRVVGVITYQIGSNFLTNSSDIRSRHNSSFIRAHWASIAFYRTEVIF